jgi:hypothetical protein
MYRVVSFAAFMFLLGSVVGATTSVSVDGAWWASLTQNEQYAAVEAIADSYPVGYTSGYIDGRLSALNAFSQSLLESRMPAAQQSRLFALYSKHAGGPLPKARPLFRKTFASYVDGITYFYSRHPEAQELTISNMLTCVQDNPDMSCDAVAADYVKHKH